MGSEVRWHIRKFDGRRTPLPGNPVLTHPLLPKSAYYQKTESTIEKDEEEQGNCEFIDPLGEVYVF